MKKNKMNSTVLGATCISIFCVLFLISCAGKAFYQNQLSQVDLIASQYKGKSTSALIEEFPNLQVDEMDTGDYRYTVNFEVEPSFEEYMLSGEYRTPYCYVSVYFFSQNGVINNYQMKRFSTTR